MSLSALIRKREIGQVATATPATFATQRGKTGGTVAKVAKVAVANSTDAKTVTAWGWLLHYPDSEPVAVYARPESTFAEVLLNFPGAISAEPIPAAPTRPNTPLTAKEETAIWAWLVLIEETDLAIIAAVLGNCRTDAEARAYFIGRAGELNYNAKGTA